MLKQSATSKLQKAGATLVKDEKFGQWWTLNGREVKLVLTDSDGCIGPDIEQANVVDCVLLNSYPVRNLAAALRVAA